MTVIKPDTALHNLWCGIRRETFTCLFAMCCLSTVSLAQSPHQNTGESAAQKASTVLYPFSLRWKHLTVTPEVFLAIETVGRRHATNTDISTPFNKIPFPVQNGWPQTEYKISGRQSRGGAYAEVPIGRMQLSTMYEADLLSDGGTSNEYTLRLRQAWGKVETATHFALTGGQMWSLVTETKKSTDAHTEQSPKTIDPQYVVGYSWFRQPALRAQQQFGSPEKMVTLAASLERTQIMNITANASVPSAVPNNNNFYDSDSMPPSSGALQNVTANTGVPDFIVKGTLDTPRSHTEGGSLLRFIRSRYYPIVSSSRAADGSVTYSFSSSAERSSDVAMSLFGSSRVSVVPSLDLAVQVMGGRSAGRYGTSQMADATVWRDGVLRPLSNYHGLLSIEFRPHKGVELSSYYGAEYTQRAVSANREGVQVGYGPRDLLDTECNASVHASGVSSSRCSSPTRSIQEVVVGILYSQPLGNAGGHLQYQANLSLVQRSLWSGQSQQAPGSLSTHEQMLHLGIRYYVP